MNYSSKILEQAVEALSSLPSIGKKSALRLVLHLIQDDSNKAIKISDALIQLQNEIKECSKCFNVSDHKVCDICQSTRRNQNVICVVESVRDVLAIEETAQFNGLYHVLGGVISPIEGIGPSEINIDPLISRIQNEEVEELIMALSPTIEGDTTIYYITKKLSSSSVAISTIARGVSFGGELEYADELTLGRSILARIPYEVVT